MKTSGNTILITGGGSGIGLALAERLVRAGNEVIICGRRPEALAQAKEKVPALQTRACDVASEEDRVSLLEWAKTEFPQLNVLVNNAGIQRRLQLPASEPWAQTRQEIAINFEAPIHLAQLFLPHLLAQPQAAIINVTSGLAFSPLANVPVYCATKAALRSFTLSLRHQLLPTSVEVIEVVPPAVDTDLGGPGLHTFGEPLDEFADSVMERLSQGEIEIAYGSALRASRASREELDEIFQHVNQRFSV
jgi:uncharacterized oxidoreductase